MEGKGKGTFQFWAWPLGLRLRLLALFPLVVWPLSPVVWMPLVVTIFLDIANWHHSSRRTRQKKKFTQLSFFEKMSKSLS
jgi:hypothetical protein